MMDTDALTEGTLQGYLRILSKRKLSITAAVVLTLGAAYLYTHRETVLYESSAEIYLAPTPTEQDVSGMSFSYDQPNVPDQVEVMEGNGVASVVQKEIGAAPPISASELGATDIMVVTAVSANPSVAAAIANAYASGYITYEQQTTVANLDSSTKILQGQLTTATNQLDQAETQLAAAQKSGDAGQQAELETKVNSLTGNVDALNQDVTDLAQAAEFGSTSAQIIDKAYPNPVPVQPDLKKNLLMGLIAGLVLGIGLVVGREYFDDTIHSEDELHLSLARSEKTSRFPILGAIPFGDEVQPGQPTHGVVSLLEPSSPQSEAYRELRTSLQFLQVREPVQVVLVTSPCGGEGKSTTVANLGVMLAKAGKTVGIASLDLRRPRLYEYLGVPNTVGFTSVLLGDTTLDDAIQPVGGVDGLGFVSAGPVPPNPAELLASPATEQIIEELKDRYDVVLIDSPPVLRVTDGVVISTMADITLLVVRAGLTTRRDMVKTLDTFAQVGSPVAGIVVNAIPSELTYKDRYYYYSAYETKELETAANGNGSNGHSSNGNGDGTGGSSRRSRKVAVSAGRTRKPAEGAKEPTHEAADDAELDDRPLPSSRRLTFADDDPGVLGASEPARPPRGPSVAAAPAATGRRPVPPKKRGPVMRFLMGTPKKRPPQTPPGRRPSGS